jgi:transcriptional regulator with XRE-family HTH domain
MNIKLGEIIVEKRKQTKLTQQELADKLGVSNTAVSKWENDINYPDISLIQPLCKILNIDIIKLLSIEEKPKFNIFKYITIILIMIILALLVAFTTIKNTTPVYELLKVSSSNETYRVSGLIIQNEETNNLLLYSLFDNNNNMGTTNESHITKITVIINENTKYTFSDTNDLLHRLNSSMINSKEMINKVKLEITYRNENSLEQKETISLNIDKY